jgi:hypothetical protein
MIYLISAMRKKSTKTGNSHLEGGIRRILE